MPDPALIAYEVSRKPNGRVIWTRIGEAYPHEEGAGLTVQLNAMPRDGRIILLELDASDDKRLDMRAKRAARQRPSTGAK